MVLDWVQEKEGEQHQDVPDVTSTMPHGSNHGDTTCAKQQPHQQQQEEEQQQQQLAEAEPFHFCNRTQLDEDVCFQ